MNIFHSHNHRKGFTLVELLVVIFIIGVLSAIIFPRFGGMREKARDTERMTDVRQIQNALEQFFNQQSRYPNSLAELTGVIPDVSITDPRNEQYTYTLNSSCDGVSGGVYSLSFEAETPQTFENDTSVTMVGESTVCVDLVRSD